MKTSNPSSGEFQDQLVNGRPLYELVGEKVAAWGADCMGDSYSYVGAVVGATYPEQGKVLRKVMPKAFILVPGYGAQGGKGADLVHFSMRTDWVPLSTLPVASLLHTSRKSMHSSVSRIMQMLPARPCWICVRISHRHWQHAKDAHLHV